MLRTSNYSFAASYFNLELDGLFHSLKLFHPFFEDVLLIAIKRENMELQGFLTLLGAG